MLKRIIAMTLVFLLVLGTLSACGDTTKTPENTAEPTPSTEVQKRDSIKVLTLGHSLAVDSNHMLALIAEAEGFPKMEVGTLYYSGCPLYRHVEFLKSDVKEYDLYISSTEDVSAPPQKMEGVSMKDALRFKDWDIIILQGGTFEIGRSETFTSSNIQTIQNYVNENKLNPNAVFGWHMPWAFPTETQLIMTYSKSDEWMSKYAEFNNDRTTMYNAFAKNVSDYILTDDSFQYFIPSGTAFENALSSYLTEFDMHRDYVHASDYARLIAAYTWFCVLTGVEQLEDIQLTTIPKNFFKSKTDLEDYTLTETEKAIVIESVNNALKNPLQITQSQYTQAPA